jgi:hypothetical protein
MQVEQFPCVVSHAAQEEIVPLTMSACGGHRSVPRAAVMVTRYRGTVKLSLSVLGAPTEVTRRQPRC